MNKPKARFFYHLDRSGNIENNKIKVIEAIDSRKRTFHINNFYGTNIIINFDFLSKHGVSYLIEGNENTPIEILLESARLKYFPDRPSRFQSVFAFNTKEDALDFAKKYDAPIGSKIYKVSTKGKSYTGDMNLLSSYDVTSGFNFKYWHDADKLEVEEVLLELPVTIHEVVGWYDPNE